MGRVIYPNTQPILVKLLAWLLHIPNNISTCMMYLTVTMPMLAAPTTNLSMSHRYQLVTRPPSTPETRKVVASTTHTTFLPIMSAIRPAKKTPTRHPVKKTD